LLNPASPGHRAAFLFVGREQRFRCAAEDRSKLPAKFVECYASRSDGYFSLQRMVNNRTSAVAKHSSQIVMMTIVDC
jgi:hypothetical protein